MFLSASPHWIFYMIVLAQNKVQQEIRPIPCAQVGVTGSDQETIREQLSALTLWH